MHARFGAACAEFLSASELVQLRIDAHLDPCGESDEAIAIVAGECASAIAHSTTAATASATATRHFSASASDSNFGNAAASVATIVADPTSAAASTSGSSLGDGSGGSAKVLFDLISIQLTIRLISIQKTYLQLTIRQNESKREELMLKLQTARCRPLVLPSCTAHPPAPHTCTRNTITQLHPDTALGEPYLCRAVARSEFEVATRFVQQRKGLHRELLVLLSLQQSTAQEYDETSAQIKTALAEVKSVEPKRAGLKNDAEQVGPPTPTYPSHIATITQWHYPPLL